MCLSRKILEKAILLRPRWDKDFRGRLAARTIPHAKLVEFADLGHAPQMQDPQAFHKALLDGLAAAPVTY
jgi:pimeloyl-ACP methyl ester carboxylesterase